MQAEGQARAAVCWQSVSGLPLARTGDEMYDRYVPTFGPSSNGPSYNMPPYHAVPYNMPPYHAVPSGLAHAHRAPKPKTLEGGRCSVLVLRSPEVCACVQKYLACIWAGVGILVAGTYGHLYLHMDTSEARW